MKRFLLILGVSAVLSCMAAAQATEQSLGEVARQLRAHKGPAAKKVYTNDDLPTGAPITILGTPPAPEQAAQEAGGEAKNATAKASAPEAKTKTQDLQKSLATEEQKLEFNQRELSVLEGGQKLQASQYYSDAGTRLRDPKAYYEEASKFQNSIAAKKQEIEARQQRIDDLKEAIRKAPSQGETAAAAVGPDSSTTATQAPNSAPAPAPNTSAPQNPQ